MSSARNASRRAAYLDASALVKLVWPERESVALGTAMTGRALVVSDLAVAEVPRAVWRRGAGAAAIIERLETLMQRIELIPVELELLSVAGALPDPGLGTLEAIHIASALSVADDVDAFVSYDRRQLAAAERMGLPVDSPGA